MEGVFFMQILQEKFPENLSMIAKITDTKNNLTIINSNYKGDKNIMTNLMNLSNNNGFDWNSKDIAEWTGKRHDNVLADIEDEINKLGEVGNLIFQLSSYKPVSAIKEYKMYKLNKKGVQQIAARYDAKVRYQIIDRMEQLQTMDTPSYMIENPAERAEKWISEYKEKERIALERDIAVRTKGQISSSREAKVMSLYGNTVRKVKKLEAQVDKLKDNDKRPGEYTALEAAGKMKVLALSGRPHEQLICQLFYHLDDSSLGRKVNNEVNGKIISSLLVNDSFIKAALKKIKPYASIGKMLLNKNYKFTME
jgi:phage regulator Rha-like protein